MTVSNSTMTKSRRGGIATGMRRCVRQAIALLPAVFALAAFVGCGMRERAPAAESETVTQSSLWPESLPEESPVDAAQVDTLYAYPPGKLIVEQARETYQAGELWLFIPRLEGKWPVLDGVDDGTLAEGIGLFDQAQLPQGPDINSNTSIAGHRDVGGMEFYHIDQIEEGDLLYLTYGGSLYAYEVCEQFVTHDADWNPIRTREFPCVTLQSCEPIGVASHRIFTVGKLIAVTENAGFPE